MPTGCPIGKAALQSLTKNYGHMIGFLEDEETDFFDALKQRVHEDIHTDADTQRLRAFVALSSMWRLLDDRLRMMNASVHVEYVPLPCLEFTRESINELLTALQELRKGFHADVAEDDLTEVRSGVTPSSRGFRDLAMKTVHECQKIISWLEEAACLLRAQLGRDSTGLGFVGRALIDTSKIVGKDLMASMRLVEDIVHTDLNPKMRI